MSNNLSPRFSPRFQSSFVNSSLNGNPDKAILEIKEIFSGVAHRIHLHHIHTSLLAWRVFYDRSPWRDTSIFNPPFIQKMKRRMNKNPLHNLYVIAMSEENVKLWYGRNVRTPNQYGRAPWCLHLLSPETFKKKTDELFVSCIHDE